MNRLRRSLSSEKIATVYKRKPAAGVALEAEHCLRLLSELHGPAALTAARRLLAACRPADPCCVVNRATLARAGGAAALPSLLRGGGDTDEQRQLLALELLVWLAQGPSSCNVHCQMVFVGAVEAILPLLSQQRAPMYSRRRLLSSGVRAAALGIYARW
jgi:hypothetical protein